MRDSLGSMIDLFVLIIAAVLFPVFVAGNCIQDLSDSEARRLGEVFLSEVSAFGGIYEEKLCKLREGLAATGGGYELSLEHKSTLCVPASREKFPEDGENYGNEVDSFTVSRSTAEICSCLSEAGSYYLDYGDILELHIRRRGDRQTVFNDYVDSVSVTGWEAFDL